MGGLKMVNLNILLDIYEKNLRKSIKNKPKLYLFERNKMMNITDYYIKHYNIFLIYEPKCRVVMSLNIDDKIINHYVNNYILQPKLEKYLDFRNIATRKNMGTNYGIKLLKNYLEKLKKYDNVYVLKIDIKKYFYSIDHNLLKKLLIDKLTDEEYKIIESIIDSTNEKYINETLDKFNISNLPKYDYGKGLPIGNLTSQFLSIFYLSNLDHYIVHNLHLKYYIRYMDDFIIIHHNKNYLYECLNKITNILNEKYFLQINKNKTYIKNIKEGFIFLGYRIILKNKKTIIILRNETLNKIKTKIKRNKYLFENNIINYQSYFNSVSNYQFSYKVSKSKVKKIIDIYS